ncbi:superoxide dismutase [Sphingomonas sp. Leaf21]|uniref:superoxide dismutase n=1 Tax=Sphingomonas sp. Leaf21 TaxID=2876550 RepID=UPI001E55F5F4|nr:superoxide dismutase [Sphingomonas sp. Leaf21]
MRYWFACLTVLATPVIAQERATVPAFTLAPLPYPATALEPVIDRETMTLHHDRHHQAYVNALNKAVAADRTLAGRSLEQLLAQAGSVPAAVRDNAGGHWNHDFFWKTMAQPGTGGGPSPELARAIDAAFGSMELMKATFKAAGAGRFGSGWVWLIVGADGRLAIITTPNQDNPLMDVAKTRGTPLLGNDVWEHAYYLKHRNRRAEYLDAWWQVVDWKTVSQRFVETMDRTAQD